MHKLVVDVNIVLTWLGFQNKQQRETAIRLFSSLVSGDLEVAAPYDLTAYDAQYLYVAQKTESKLVTSDPKLLAVEDWCVGLGVVEI